MYVIKKGSLFVADMSKNPTGGSYTNKLQYAATYSTKLLAEASQCPENEYVVEYPYPSKY